MIKAKAVTKKFDNFTALDGLDMHVPKGSIYGLVGPNGAGKTTIINHISGAYKQDSGSVEIDGKPVYENTALKQRVVTIADDWYYFGSAAISDMARFYRNIYKGFNGERYEKLGALFNMSEKKQIRSLSKGMKKQVAFRMALSCMPEVLMLDEPLDGLDPVMRKQILNLIIDDVAAREMTVLVSSHNLRELEDICDHVGIIHKGKMIIEKPLDDLKGGVHKYQLAFSDGLPKELAKQLDILHISNIASVYHIIVKGDMEKNDEIIKSFLPIVFDKVSLTLEEIFIYELGGLGYFACEMILNKTVRISKKSFGGLLVYAVCVTAVLMFCGLTTFFGYETYVPKTEEIASVSIEPGYRQKHQSAGDGGVINAVTDIHKDIIANTKEDTLGKGAEAINIDYTLKSGKIVKRKYVIESEKASEYMSTMFEYDEYKSKYTEIGMLNIGNINYCDIQIITTNDNYETDIQHENLSGEDSKNLFYAVAEDLKSMTYSQYRAYPGNKYFEISVSEGQASPEPSIFTEQHEYYRVVEYTINQYYTNTLEYLAEHGFTLE